MADEDEIFEEDDLEQEEETEEPEANGYEGLLEEEPLRDVDLDEFDSLKTISEEEEETEHKTDIQAILRELTPKVSDPRMKKLLDPAMKSRVFPDNYMDKHYLLAASMIEEHEEDADIVSYISITQDILSLAFEGRRISDLLELAGAAQEEETERLVKELGL